MIIERLVPSPSGRIHLENVFSMIIAWCLAINRARD